MDAERFRRMAATRGREALAAGDPAGASSCSRQGSRCGGEMRWPNSHTSGSHRTTSGTFGGGTPAGRSRTGSTRSSRSVDTVRSPSLRAAPASSEPRATARSTDGRAVPGRTPGGGARGVPEGAASSLRESSDWSQVQGCVRSSARSSIRILRSILRPRPPSDTATLLQVTGSARGRPRGHWLAHVGGVLLLAAVVAAGHQNSPADTVRSCGRRRTRWRQSTPDRTRWLHR